MTRSSSLEACRSSTTLGSQGSSLKSPMMELGSGRGAAASKREHPFVGCRAHCDLRVMSPRAPVLAMFGHNCQCQEVYRYQHFYHPHDSDQHRGRDTPGDDRWDGLGMECE